MKYFRTDLVCPECGNVTTIQRRLGSERAVGHIKDLYCYQCQKVTKHYEVRDVSKFLYENRDNNCEKGEICKLILARRKK